MSADSTSESHAFYEYLGTRLQTGGAERTPEDLVQEWRMRQAEFNTTVTDLREAIAEMEAGDQGRPLAEVAEEIRKEHHFSTDDV